MRCKAARISLIIYLFIWFGVIVPGHKRGIVTVPGSMPSVSECPGCCCCDSPKPGSPDPNSNRAAHCAICDFTAHLTLPPTFDFSLLPMGLVDVIPAPIAQDRVARMVLTPFDGRGPPSLA